MTPSQPDPGRPSGWRVAARAGVVAVLLTASACSSSGEPPARTVPTPSSTPSPSATAEPTPDPSPSPTAAAAPSVEAAVGTLLTGNGIEASRGLFEFGAGFDEVSEALLKSLGQPSADSGLVTSGELSGCVGPRLRTLEYADGAMEVLFRSQSGEPLMFAWRLSDGGPQVPLASAFVGDVTTYEFGVGTTVGQLREGAGESFSTVPPQEPFGPRFDVQDQSPGLSGRLSGLQDSDTVEFVEAGQSCGE